jgi:Na+/H+ antiporter NhaD/arsenite permease-like protein
VDEASIPSELDKRRAGSRGNSGAMVAAVLIFALTYAVIAGAKIPYLSLDRPSAALLGAVAMVAVGALSPSQAGAAVNGDTIGLLLGTMILAAYLTEAAFFRWAAWKVIATAKTPRTLLVGIVLVAGVLSAFLVNDTICLMMTPLVLAIVEQAELPPAPYLLAVCFGSNAGSAATLTGNPQNMIVGTLSRISYARFSGALALPALVALAIVAVTLLVGFRSQLPRGPLCGERPPRPPVERRLLVESLGATLLVVTGFLAGLPLSWTALGGAALLMAMARRPPREGLTRVDWPLLMFFAGLFVVVAGISRAGVAASIHEAFAPLLGHGPLRQTVAFSVLTTAASQVVSNVPFVILAAQWIPKLSEPELAWLATALASTLAGNLTLVGSVANLIVMDTAERQLGRPALGFWAFFKYGAFVTGLTLVAGLALLLAEWELGVIR